MKYLLFFSLLFLGACSSKNVIEEIKSPIQNNDDFYFYSGVGDSQKEVISEGLELLASTLSSEVSSVFIMRKKSINHKYHKSVQKEIKIVVKEISFVYDIVSTLPKQNRYFVSIQIDRKKSAMRYVHRLKRTLWQIENKLKAFSDLKEYLFLKEYPFDKLYYQVDIISILDPLNSEKGLLEQTIQSLEKKRYSDQKKLSFNISSRDDYLRDIVIDLLSDAQFTISSNAAIQLSVNFGKIEIEEIYGEYHADGSAVIKMVKNQEIITKIIPLSALPSSDQKGARDNLIKAFQKEFPLFIKKEFR